MIQAMESSSSDAHDHRQPRPSARARLLRSGQLADEDRDEDDVVDAEHDLERASPARPDD
jgi:hypothetical protein